MTENSRKLCCTCVGVLNVCVSAADTQSYRPTFASGLLLTNGGGGGKPWGKVHFQGASDKGEGQPCALLENIWDLE